ncbi:hypothetical protein C8R44DRAFT_846236 [Mycena epipterygia]|nr:hypothetical protein C8R44DRAFT_846236 [Mycena epipterygia]
MQRSVTPCILELRITYAFLFLETQFIVASIVAKYPTFTIAPTAFGELQAALALVEQGAKHSFLAQDTLRVRNKAMAVYTEIHPLTPLRSPNPNTGELADEEDFESLGGSRAFLPRAPVQNRHNTQNQNMNPTPPPSMHMPALISGGLMPLSSPPDSWQFNISDSVYAGFAFKAPIGGGTQPLSSADSLEAYLNAQIQGVNSSYPEAVPEVDWEMFVSSLQ